MKNLPSDVGLVALKSLSHRLERDIGFDGDFPAKITKFGAHERAPFEIRTVVRGLLIQSGIAYRTGGQFVSPLCWPRKKRKDRDARDIYWMSHESLRRHPFLGPFLDIQN